MRVQRGVCRQLPKGGAHARSAVPRCETDVRLSFPAAMSRTQQQQQPQHAPRAQPAHANPPGRRARPALPLIPDMRFEATFLRNVRPFVRLPTDDAHPAGAATDVVAGDAPGDVAAVHHRRDVEVRWGSVLWVALRDVVFSPLMWCVLLSPFVAARARADGSFRALCRGTASALAKPLMLMVYASLQRSTGLGLGARASEGKGAAWLRERLAGLMGSVRGGLGGVGAGGPAMAF
jgi:hypothetical protein